MTGDHADEAERLLASHPEPVVTVGIIGKVGFAIIRRLAKERLGLGVKFTIGVPFIQ